MEDIDEIDEDDLFLDEILQEEEAGKKTKCLGLIFNLIKSIINLIKRK